MAANFQWKTREGKRVTVAVACCPFCGEPPKLICRAGVGVSRIGCGQDYWRGHITCKCGLETAEYPNPRKLEAVWNRRADIRQPKEQAHEQ